MQPVEPMNLDLRTPRRLRRARLIARVYGGRLAGAGLKGLETRNHRGERAPAPICTLETGYEGLVAPI